MQENAWQDDTLGELLSLEYGVGLPETSRSGDGFPVYGSSGAVGKHRNYLVQGPGIVVGRKGTVGAVVWSEDSFWPIDTTYYVQRKRKNDLRWLYWCLANLPLKRLDSSTGVPGLNRNDAYLVKVPVPPLPEQRRIVEILDTVDAAIQQTETLIAKLKQMEAGLLHDLLRCGLDEHGQLRDPDAHPEQFKDSPLGRIPREWEVCQLERKLQRIIDYRGKTPIKANWGIPLITAKNVRDGFLDPEPREYIDAATYDRWMTRGLPVEGDILFTTEAPLGNVAKVPGYKLAVGQRLLTLQADCNILDSKYLFWLLMWPGSRRRITAKSTGSTVVGIKQSVFRTILFQFPPLHEQTYIANILDAQNIRIQIEEAYRDKLKQLKKGLMDDLLTGRVRVNVAEEVAP